MCAAAMWTTIPIAHAGGTFVAKHKNSHPVAVSQSVAGGGRFATAARGYSYCSTSRSSSLR
jgi:hypothetical protein